jgi:hypothetical protein
MKKFSLIILAIISIIVPFIYYGAMIVRDIEFDRDCTSYLYLSANANSIEIAEERLTTAIEYLEEHNLTSGDCRFIIANRPANNIEYWYNNLKSAQLQLREIITNNTASELEKSNVLIKLRETLLDDDDLVIPENLCFYPNQTIIIIMSLIIWGLWILAFAIFTNLDDWSYSRKRRK